MLPVSLGLSAVFPSRLEKLLRGEGKRTLDVPSTRDFLPTELLDGIFR